MPSVMLKSPTPSVNDPDVQSLIKRYPPTIFRTDLDDQTKRHLQVKKIIEDSKNHLLNESSKMILQENDLKLLLERFRGD